MQELSGAHRFGTQRRMLSLYSRRNSRHRRDQTPVTYTTRKSDQKRWNIPTMNRSKLISARRRTRSNEARVEEATNLPGATRTVRAYLPMATQISITETTTTMVPTSRCRALRTLAWVCLHLHPRQLATSLILCKETVEVMTRAAVETRAVAAVEELEEGDSTDEAGVDTTKAVRSLHRRLRIATCLPLLSQQTRLRCRRCQASGPTRSLQFLTSEELLPRTQTPQLQASRCPTGVPANPARSLLYQFHRQTGPTRHRGRHSRRTTRRPHQATTCPLYHTLPMEPEVPLCHRHHHQTINNSSTSRTITAMANLPTVNRSNGGDRAPSCHAGHFARIRVATIRRDPT